MKKGSIIVGLIKKKKKLQKYSRDKTFNKMKK